MANKFGKELQAYALKMGEELEAVDRSFKLSLYERLMEASPVDTGRFKGNWQTSNGAPAAGQVADFAPSQSFTPANASQISEAAAIIQPFTVTYFTNNVPYSFYVEKLHGVIGKAKLGARAALAEAIAEND